jgi:putative inorganic carbon (HCO3(-)) transporter
MSLMTRFAGQLTAAASWALVGGLFLAPATLGKLIESRDLWAHLLLCATAGAAIVGALLSGRPRLRVRRADIAILALLLAYLAASFVTVFPRGTVVELLRLLDYLALYALIRTFLQERRMLLAGILAFACGGVLCAVIGLQEYLVTALSGDLSWRAFGPFYNPNLLAAMLLMVIPAWVALVLMARLPAVKLAAGVGLLLCWLCFFVTGSKGGALALMGALLVGVVLAPDPAKGGLAKRALLGVGLVVLVGAAALLLPPIRIRVLTAFGPQSNSMMFRYYTWLATWHMALDRPLLGFGPGTFNVAFPRFAIAGHTGLAHETYLQIAAETGFVGLSALLAALGTLLASAVRAARTLAGDHRTVACACAAGMVGFLLHNVVDYAWHVTATGLAFWTLAGLAAAAAECPAEPEPLPEPPVRGKRKQRPPKPAETRRVPRPALVAALVATVVLALPVALFLQAQSLADVQDFEAASRFDPLNEVYHRRLALMAQDAARSGRPELYSRATDEWHKVARLRPTFPGAHYNLGLIYEAQHDADRALAEYREAERLAPTWTDALVAEGRLLEKTQRAPQALTAWKRLDALSESPLFRYRAVTDDLDPNFAWAWIGIGDSLPWGAAQPLYVKAARYLREVAAANRRMEGIWVQSGEWDRRQGPEFAELAEEVAQRHVKFVDPGPRLRAALLLVDAGLEPRAEEQPVPPGTSERDRLASLALIRGWADYVEALHLQARGRDDAAKALIRASAARLGGSLNSYPVTSLRAGPHGWSDAEVATLNEPSAAASRLLALQDR